MQIRQTKKIIMGFFILSISVILNACGFHLRGFQGSYSLPFKSIYLECSNVVMCNNFQTIVTTQDLAKFTSNPKDAEVTIKLFDEQTHRSPQTFNSIGRIAAYTLAYSAKAQAWKHGQQIGNDILLTAQSVMQYNDSTILSNSQNENTFWDNLHEDVANQLVRRLMYLKPNSTNNIEANP